MQPATFNVKVGDNSANTPLPVPDRGLPSIGRMSCGAFAHRSTTKPDWAL
jgi:hypothetical protein